MLGLFIWMIKVKANWQAKLLTFGWIVGFSIKGYVMSRFYQDEAADQTVTFIDCNGDISKLVLHYKVAGWLYYSDEFLFKTVLWILIYIYLCTSLRLGFLLELNEAMSESRHALGQGVNLEEILEKQRQDNLKVQVVKKRGDCKKMIAHFYIVIVEILVLIIYIVSFVMKKNSIESL